VLFALFGTLGLDLLNGEQAAATQMAVAAPESPVASLHLLPSKETPHESRVHGHTALAGWKRRLNQLVEFQELIVFDQRYR